MALLDGPLLQHGPKGSHSCARAYHDHWGALCRELHYTWLYPHRHLHQMAESCLNATGQLYTAELEACSLSELTPSHRTDNRALKLVYEEHSKSLTSCDQVCILSRGLIWGC